MTLPRPSVTLHFAQTLDGRIAGRGARAELSTSEGIEHAHRARAAHDAVLVGIRTVVVDDPQLTVRACEGRQPWRVVLSSEVSLPDAARLLGPDAGGGAVLVFGAEGRATAAASARLAARGAEVCLVPATAGGWVSLPHALAALHERGIRRLLVEGGGRVLTSFVRERLADRAEIEIAPLLFGDAAVAAFGALTDVPQKASVALRRPTVERLGHNLLVRGELEYPS
jgi:5-amino-6-(5-phosphoribosylamino)uracil reductase/diaminohydroxyphosphoribosylaminopyrimidine deaminase/5-amino-6-(5-phosphoribosylamino)uracil reductase